jgi:antitoxin ParD1/3/4
MFTPNLTPKLWEDKVYHSHSQDSKEYTSKSELINDLVRQARKQQAQVDWIKAKLEKAESSGFTNESREDILSQSKKLING